MGTPVQFRNTEGNPVDPVPFFVAIAIAFLITHAWGPLYLLALGLTLTESFVVVTVLWLGLVAAAFRQFVWLYRPEQRVQVSVERRFRKLLYALMGGMLLNILFALPFYI